MLDPRVIMAKMKKAVHVVKRGDKPPVSPAAVASFVGGGMIVIVIDCRKRQRL
jgi:hypothetical protein